MLTIGLLFFAAAIIGGDGVLDRRTVQRDRFELPTTRPSTGWCSGRPVHWRARSWSVPTSGYAAAQLGVGDPPSATRLWRSCLAAIGAALVMGSVLLLDLACRVPKPPD